MDHVDSEEPAAKIKPIDFSMCIKCQKEEKNDKLACPKHLSSYETFLDKVNLRAEIGNPDFINLSKRLSGLTSKDLVEKDAKWHRNCYSDATSNCKIERDRKRQQNMDSQAQAIKKGRPFSTSTNTGKVTRSSVDQFNRHECFFCQGTDSSKYNEQKHACQSATCGNAIKEIVRSSNYDSRKIRLADTIVEGDLLSRDVLYHNSCKIGAWRKYVQGPKRCASQTNNYIIAVSACNTSGELVSALVCSGKIVFTSLPTTGLCMHNMFQNTLHAWII